LFWGKLGGLRLRPGLSRGEQHDATVLRCGAPFHKLPPEAGRQDRLSVPRRGERCKGEVAQGADLWACRAAEASEPRTYKESRAGQSDC
jgi:hypothetical protein